jgi:hypothetical protein
MKKSKFYPLIAGFAAMVAVISMAGCASSASSSTGGSVPSASTQESSSGRRVAGRVPQFVKDALKDVPEDALVGIGTAKLSTDNLSKTLATTRARAEISRQMNTMIKDMVRDYTATSEADPEGATISFQENITVALSEAKLTGSYLKDFDYDESNACWVVVVLGKADTVKEINQSVAAAKLKVPAMASFDAEARMEAAFDKQKSEEIGYDDKTP